MKTVENKFLKFYNVIITVLIALLGFACSCDPVDEYGSPSARFIVNGRIESAENNDAIENIKVVMQGDSVVTDENGNYQVIDNWGFPGDQTYAIQFQDIDSVENGEFENLDTIVEFKDSEFTGGDGNWDNGETEIEFNIKLNPKK